MFVGLLQGRRHPDKYLVPALGFRSVSGLAGAAAYAIAYDQRKKGIRVDQEALRVAAFEALHMDPDIEQDSGTSYPGFYFAFTIPT